MFSCGTENNQAAFDYHLRTNSTSRLKAQRGGKNSLPIGFRGNMDSKWQLLIMIRLLFIVYEVLNLYWKIQCESRGVSG